MTPDERTLWRRVEEALDERRDPLADPDLARDLEASPETLAATHRLVARLGALAPAPPAARRPFAPLGIAAAAALFAGVVGGSAWHGTPAADEFEGAHIYETQVLVEHTAAAEPRVERIVHVPERVVTWQVAGRTRP